MKIRVPGKLIIAGEYAVLHPNQRAMVMAVNRYLEVSCDTKGDPVSQMVSETGTVLAKWTLVEGKPQWIEGASNTFVVHAITNVYAFLVEVGLPPLSVLVTLSSTLNHPKSGLSYGLGSSGAVVVGLVKGLLSVHFEANRLSVYDEKYFKDCCYRLAMITHFTAQGNGSGVDVAASCYGGVLFYDSLDAQWLMAVLAQMDSIRSVLTMPWRGGRVKRVQLPTHLDITVAWTGQKASSQMFVSRYQQLLRAHPEVVETYLNGIEGVMKILEKACEEDDVTEFLNGIRLTRRCLKDLSEGLGLALETRRLKLFCDYYERKGAAKLSGAGGGDCALGFKALL